VPRQNSATAESPPCDMLHDLSRMLFIPNELLILVARPLCILLISNVLLASLGKAQGQAGVSLVPVMGASTNTGISTTPGQCVLHVTIHAGQGGVPSTVTDIVVLNAGPSPPLTGNRTVKASARVRGDDGLVKVRVSISK